MDKLAQSLAEGFAKERDILYEMDYEDTKIVKIAGIDLYQPTEDNVERFMRKYIMNEIAFFPKTVGVDIQLIPTSFNTAKKGDNPEVKDAHGMVILKLHGAKIELPFIIRDAEFVPFDVIQMKGQRVPYSRENLGKILVNIDRIANNPALINKDSPYLGTEKMVNSLTDPGFLGDTLRIQDQARTGRNTLNPGELVVSASDYDELLEKTAKIQPLSKKDFEKIEKFLIKKFADEFVNEMEKIAEEDTSAIDNHAKLVFEKFKDLNFVDVNMLPNGAKVVFPEKDGAEITMRRAIVLKEVVVPEYSSRENNDVFKAAPNTVLIVTDDGRFVTLKNGSKFYAIKKEEDWALPTMSVKGMIDDGIYMAIIGDKAIHPFIVKGNRNLDYSEDSVKQYGPRPFSFRCRVYPEGRYFSIAQVPGKKFEAMRKENATEVYQNKLKPELLTAVISALPHEFFGVDDSVRVIKINGMINDYLVNPKELTFTKSDDEIFKSAAEDGRVTLRVVDKERGLYDLQITWKDTSKKLFKMEKREFKGINEGKVKGILKAAGLEYSAILGLIFKAKADNNAVITLPESATPEKISGGYVENKAKQTLEKIKKNVYAKDVAETAVAEVLGRQLGEVISAVGPKAIDLVEKMQVFASETEALGIKFEKLASEYKNDQMLKLAKLMVIQNRIDNATLGALKKNEKYPFVKEAMRKIVDMKPDLEKLAYDLISLKAAQYENKNELVSPNVIGAAVRNLDRMYKMAKAVLEEAPTSCDNSEEKETGKEVDLQEEAKKALKKKETTEDKVVDKENK